MSRIFALAVHAWHGDGQNLFLTVPIPINPNPVPKVIAAEPVHMEVLNETPIHAWSQSFPVFHLCRTCRQLVRTLGAAMKKEFDRDTDYDEDDSIDGMGFCYGFLAFVIAFSLASWFFG